MNEQRHEFVSIRETVSLPASIGDVTNETVSLPK